MFDSSKTIHIKSYPGKITYPIFVAEYDYLRIGAISFDPINFVTTSDNNQIYNFYELIVMPKILYFTNKFQTRIDNIEKQYEKGPIKYYKNQLERLQYTENVELMDFLGRTIRSLFHHYDIIITENIDCLQNIGSDFHFRGENYPGKDIISKFYFKEFLNGLAMYGVNHGLNKFIIPVGFDRVKLAHNTCHICGAHYENLVFNILCQWKCPKCNTIHDVGFNTAHNLRYKYFDEIMQEANLPFEFLKEKPKIYDIW